MNWWKKQHLFVQVGIGAVVGIILGLILKDNVIYISPIGDIFIRLLQWLIVPLTFLVLIDGITSLPSIKSLRSIGGLTIIYYMFTTILASTIGITVALIMNPGKNSIGMLTNGEEISPEEFNFVENLISWTPDNLFSSFVEMNMLQIIIGAVIIGIALLVLGEKTSTIRGIFHEGAVLMLKVTDIIMYIAPLGILALIAQLVGTTDMSIITSALYYVLSIIIGLTILLFIVYPIFIALFTKYKPIPFFKSISPVLLLAAATSSSNATLPASMNTSKKMGISDKIYGFTLPLGATINMDGLAVTFGVTAIFAANIYNIPITIGLIAQFVFLGLALSMGTAGARGADIVMMAILMTSLGLPLEIVAIYAAVSPLVDAGNTTNNIAGDLTGTAIVHSKYGDKIKEL